ncbi:MAG: energy transducer TonB [Burkholderiales bacterium]
MLRMSADAGARRLIAAAGISLLLHAALVLAVNRGMPGSNGAPALPSTPLAAQLVTAISESGLPAASTIAGSPAESVPRTAGLAPSSAGIATAATESGKTYYFKASELDRRPFPLSRVEVPPPESATTESASVMIRLRISENGRIDDAKILMGTGNREFEDAALREFSSARFYPGYRGNLPVRSEMLIEVTLRPPPQPARPQAVANVNGD